MTPDEVLEQRIHEARVYASRGTQNHHDDAVIALADIRTALLQQAEKREASEEERTGAAVMAERSRCAQWAQAMRSGQLDDIRSVISAINSGGAYTEEVDE